jgi:hypothetical protein
MAQGPTGFLHSIQGLGDGGTEFLLVFDDGNFSEDSTSLLTDYLARTPKEVLGKNLIGLRSRGLRGVRGVKSRVKGGPKLQPLSRK